MNKNVYNHESIENIPKCSLIKDRALIGGGGGEYSYIRILPNKFLLKSVVFKFISKEISWVEDKYMNIHTPPPPPQINTLVSALIRDEPK